MSDELSSGPVECTVRGLQIELQTLRTQFADVCERAEILTTRAADDIERLNREVRMLINAGGALSNCAFNLAQRNPGQLTARDIETLDVSRLAWDAALRIVKPPNT